MTSKVRAILSGEIDPFYALGILINMYSYQYEGFGIRQFDNAIMDATDGT